MAKSKELTKANGGFTVQFQMIEPLAEGYMSRRVDMTLTQGQAEMASRLACTLRKSGVVMANGRPVVTSEHAIRWILEFLCECEEQTAAKDGAA